MKITQWFKKDFIIENIESKDKRSVLMELSRACIQDKDSIDPESMTNALLDREKLGSTGIGDGIAIPHGKLAGLDEMLISFGISRGGIDFNSMDGKPVHLFFLLIAPENSTGQHLKVLARISRMLKDGTFRHKLMAATSKDEIYRIIAEKDDAS
ncbi:MAG: PTS sugar transporter subunit IIA [Syntrophales bacterium]|jgi:PTS system nitrogen regulatory IIA component